MDVHILDPETGYFISEAHQRIAEIIKDYEPTLELVWIPPNKRNFNDTFPFAVVHHPEGRESYVVRKLKEDEVDNRLLAWLFANDQERNSPLSMLDKIDLANELIKAKKQEEELAAKRDVALSILKSPLNRYKHDGVVYQ